jgi:hypothetical protein
MVSINQVVDIVADIAAEQIGKKHIPGPLGVRGRNSEIGSSGHQAKAVLGTEPAAACRSQADVSLDRDPVMRNPA